MALELSKVAERVTLSHHLKPRPKTVFPPNVDQRSDVAALTETTAKFEDGSEQEYDLIFYCTGYQYKFPFLSVDCGISVDDNHVEPLYKHIINIKYPTMGLIGLPVQVCASQMFDLQARFCVNLWNGTVPMPSAEHMTADLERDTAERLAKGYSKRQLHMMGPVQEKYYADLAETAQLKPLKKVITKIHNETHHFYLDELTTFRSKKYHILDDETYIQVK